MIKENQPFTLKLDASPVDGDPVDLTGGTARVELQDPNGTVTIWTSGEGVTFNDVTNIVELPVPADTVTPTGDEWRAIAVITAVDSKVYPGEAFVFAVKSRFA